MPRIASPRFAALLTAGLLVAAPAALHAQKALVYCPVGIDASGCNAIVTALNAAPTLFPGGVDGGYDGTQGTTDLATADLSVYAVFVVPSLADGPDVQPYALLRDGTIAGRIRSAFIGRTAVWSGTPDVGSSNRSAKDRLIRNLADWGRPDLAGTHGPGLVALQDNSDDPAARYGWLSGIGALSLTADTTFEVYSNVQALTATGSAILTNSDGLQIGYTNMASYGLVRAAGSAGSAATDEVTGGRSARVVLVTLAGEPSDPNIATVRTDREDYSPGDTVTITGAGWEPGETVTLAFREDSAIDVHETLSTVADPDGHIYNRGFFPDSLDLGVRFVLTATGLTSGRTAQATFTDAATITIATATVNGGATTNVVVGQSITVVLTTGAPTTDTWATTEYVTSPATTTICNDHPDHAAPPPATETFTVTAPGTPGTFSALFTPYKSSACNGGGNQGTTKTLAGAIVVSKGSTSTAVTSSLTPSVTGQSVTFTATVSPVAPAVGTPTGTVQFKIDGVNSGGPVTLSGGTATLASSALTTAGSPHAITAVYGGNASFLTSTSAALNQSVNKAGTVTTVADAGGGTVFGQGFTFTAVVAAQAPGSGTPTGQVQFRVDGGDIGTSQTLIGGSATSPSVTGLAVGSHTLTAVYAGDPNYFGSNSAVVNHTVGTASTTTAITTDTPDPSTVGQAVAVTFTVAASAPGSGTPTGNVTVTVSGGSETCTGTVAAGTCSITLTTTGARTLTATYAGNGNFAGSTSAGAAHQVNAAATTTVVASSANPSTFGQSVTFTATVTSGATPVTVGSVSFIEGGTCAAPGTTLQAATALNGSGQVAYTTSTLAGGSHTITACYGGGGSFVASSGNLAQTVNAAATSLAAAAASGSFGGTAALSATLTSGGNPVSGKTIAFTLNGTSAGTAATNASGTASIPAASLGSINAGSYLTGVAASFAGDASLSAASGTNSLTVTAKTTTVTLTVATPSVAYGGTATVSGKWSENLAGRTITFSIDGTPVATGTTNNGGNTGNVSINLASFPAIGAGSHNVTATFAGETNFSTSSDTKSLTVTQVSATVTLTNLSQAYDGSPKSATVTTAPTGLSTSVTYNGSAPAPTNAGSYAVVATITDPNYSGTASGTLVITKANQTITFAAIPNHTFGDAPFTVSATASSGLAVTFAVGASDQCTIAGATVTLTGAGSCTVTASQSGDGNYNAAAPVARNFTIAPTAATVVLNGLSQTYDGTPRLVTATTTPAGLTVGITYDGSATAPTNAGSYAVVGTISDVNYTGSASGTLVVAKADQTITFAALADKTLGDPDFNLSASAGSGLAVSFAASGSCSVTGNSVHLTGAGSCTITASQAGNANYNPATDVSHTFAIAKGQATLALSDLSHTYDGTPKSATVTTTPSGLTVVSVTYDGSPTAPTNAGSYAVAASLTNANYQATDATGTLVIAKAAQTIDFAALTDKAFGDAPFSVSATGGGSGNPVTFSSTTPATCSVSGSTVTLEAAGLCTIAADQAGNANYEAASQVTRSFTLAKGQATLALSDLSHIYDGTPKSATVTTTPSGLSGVSVTYDGSATAPTNAGSYAVVASLTNANYQATDATGTLVIAKAAQTVAFAALANRTFGEPDFTVSATSSSGLAVSFAAGGKCTVTGSSVHITGAGSCTITASQAVNQNYEAAPVVDRSFGIAKATQTIVFAPLSPTTFGDPPVSLSATGGASGNPVVFASTTPSTCSVSGTTASNLHAGSCTINANQAGNDDYDMAAEVSQSFTIAKAAATLVLSDLTHTYDGSPKAAAVTVTPAGLTVVSVTYDGSATAPTNAGSYAVVASLNNADYEAPDATGTLVIEKAAQTITFAALTGKTFGDADFSLSASASSGLAVSFAASGNCTVSGSTAHITGAGSCTITASQAGNQNYEAASDVARSFSIAKAAAAVVLNGLTQTYDGTPRIVTATTTPAGLTVDVTYDGSATAPVDAGSYAIVGTVNDPNYEGSASGTLVVNKADQTIAFAPLADKTFGDPDFSVSAVATSGLGVGFAASGKCTVTGSSVHLTGAASCTITASQVGNPNYNAAPDVSQSFTIAKAAATLVLSDLTHTYDGSPKAAAVTVTPAGLTGVSVTYDGSPTAPTTAGSYAVLATLVNDDYEAPDVTGTLVIEKAAQTITFTQPADRTFGDAPFVLSASGGASGNLVVFASITPGTCSVSGSTATILHAGSCTINANQAGSANYEAAPEASRTLTINKAPATLALSALTYTYDATPKSATVTTTPLGLAGVSVTYDGSATAPTNAGSYAVLATLTNQDYAAPDASGTLVINQAPLTITAEDKTRVYGDAAAAFTVAYAGFVGGDGQGALGGTLAFTGTATTAVNVGPYAITPGGLTSSNYAISFVDGTLNITVRPVTVTADAKTKVYGDADPALTYQLTSGTLALSDAFSGGLTRAAGETVAGGPYAIQQGTLALNPNYALTFAGSALTITKKTITVVAGSKSKLYGAPLPTFTGTLTGVVPGDNITANYLAGEGGIVTVATAVGQYAIVPVLVDPDGKLANYSVSPTNGQLTITPASLTVTADAKTRQFGAANPAFTATISGFVLGQNAATANVTGGAAFSGTGPSAVQTTAVGTYVTTPAAGTLSAPNYTFLTANGTSFVNGQLTITQAASTTVAGTVSAPYSEVNQNVTVTAAVTTTSPLPVGEGSVKFTLKNGALTIGSPVTAPVSSGAATATYIVPGVTDVGNYAVLAEYTSAGNYVASQNTGTLTIQPANLEDETATTDADFRSVDGVDALFKKDGNLSTLRLQNTNPGTIHYQLTLNNITGVVIDAANGNTLKTILEVPSMTSCGSVSCPSSVDKNAPAWVLKSHKALHVHPDDRTDDMTVQFSYKASGTCTDETTGYTSNLSSISDGAPKCIRVTGYAVPKRERARLDVHFEFRWKDTGGWGASPDPKLYFRSGFAFKSTTIVNFPVAPSVRTSYESAGLVVAGQRVTAMGGFVFNPFGAPPPAGYLVRAFMLPGDASCSISPTDPKVVAQDQVSTDGFFFIWRKGADQMNLGSAELPGKIKYYLQVCNGITPVVGHSVRDKLVEKEFDEEDFDVP